MHQGLHNFFNNTNSISDDTHTANFEPKLVECRSIPPERIGINGKYDHDGLASRVRLLLSEQLTNSTEALRVSQRGRVVVVIGPWVTEEMAQKIITLTLQVEGATSVELNGVHVRPRSRPIAYLESNQYFPNVS